MMIKLKKPVSHFTVLALSAIWIGMNAQVASAQNVLLPDDTTSKPKTSAVLPAPATTDSSGMSDMMKALLPGSTPAPVAQSPAPQVPAMYLPPAQQKSMLDMEKRNNDSMQQGLQQIQQSLASVNQQLQYASKTQTPEQRAELLKQQQTLTQASTQIGGEAQKSQRRLAVLQAGPVKANDLMQLYQ